MPIVSCCWVGSWNEFASASWKVESYCADQAWTLDLVPMIVLAELELAGLYLVSGRALHKQIKLRFMRTVLIIHGRTLERT